MATALGAGLSPWAPGTAGALVGIALFGLLLQAGAGWFALVWVGLSLAGVWSAGVAEVLWDSPDDGRIVIDEVSGQGIALLPLAFDPGTATISWVVTAFVAFRVFDIAKPGPVRWAERRLHGGLGVMADDWVAGGLAAGALAALRWTVPFVAGATAGGTS